MNRPSTLPFTSRVISRSAAFDDAPDSDNDHLILPLMQYQRISEMTCEAYKAFHRTEASVGIPLELCQLDAALEAWWDALPDHLRHTG